MRAFSHFEAVFQKSVLSLFGNSLSTNHQPKTTLAFRNHVFLMSSCKGNRECQDSLPDLRGLFRIDQLFSCAQGFVILSDAGTMHELRGPQCTLNLGRWRKLR
jgi:hypothetical protein